MRVFENNREKGVRCCAIFLSIFHSSEPSIDCDFTPIKCVNPKARRLLVEAKNEFPSQNVDIEIRLRKVLSKVGRLFGREEHFRVVFKVF